MYDLNKTFVECLTGIDEDSLQQLKEANAMLDDDFIAEDFYRSLFKAAAVMLSTINPTENRVKQASVLTTMANVQWTPIHSEVKEDIMETISMSKQAAIPVGEIAKFLVALPLLAGVPIGAASYALNRNVNEDAKDNEALKEKIKYYDLVTSELENRLNNRQIV